MIHHEYDYQVSQIKTLMRYTKPGSQMFCSHKNQKSLCKIDIKAFLMVCYAVLESSFVIYLVTHMTANLGLSSNQEGSHLFNFYSNIIIII